MGVQSPLIRQGVRGTLHTLGLCAVEDANSLGRVNQCLHTEPFGLLVLDRELGGSDTAFLTREVRLGRSGAEPFAVVVILVANPDEQAVRAVMGSGADAMLSVPFSPDQLTKRVVAAAAARRSFVATHDYVGPERRQPGAAGRGGETRQFDVPNPLASRPAGEACYAAAVAAARDALFGERRRRLAAYLGREAVALLDLASDGFRGTENPGTRLYRLEEAALELASRLGGGVSNPAVDAYLSLTRSLKGTPGAFPVSYYLELRALGRAIAVTYAATQPSGRQ